MTHDTTYCIIGGGIAGTSAAEEIRKRDLNGTITIIDEEPYRLYSRVMLSKPPYFLGRVPKENVFLRKPEWYTQQNITLASGTAATGLDPSAQTVTLANEDVYHYDKLLLALGAQARPWSVEGGGTRGVYSLRTIDDAEGIISTAQEASHAIAIGGGFIGFEICELLRMMKIDTSIIIREPFFWGLLWDEESGAIVERALAKGGVRMIKNDEVVRINGLDHITDVETKTGQKLPVDLLVVGIGVRCRLQIFEESGLHIHRGILANEFLETNLPNVWAAGDAAEYRDLILDEDVLLGNWTNAQMQGKAAGRNMAGTKEPFTFVSSYQTTGFGIAIAFVGDVAPKEGRDVIVRTPPDGSWRVRILYEKDEIVGATLINRSNELFPMGKLISSNVKVSAVQEQLTDPSTDLKTLVPGPAH